MQSANRVDRVLRFLKTHRRICSQLQCRRCLTHARRLKIRALKDYARRRFRNRALFTSDHARNCNSAARIRDHQIAGAQFILRIVQRDDLLALMRSPDKDRLSAQQCAIERMHRLRQFRQDVIRQIDNVVDWIQPNGRQPELQPQWRWPNFYVLEDQRAVSRA